MDLSGRDGLDVVIVGGSIAGLCVGVALKALPQINSITILEKYNSAQLQDQGAGIRVGDELAEFLQRYADATQSEYSIPGTFATFLDVDGRVLSRRTVVGNYATTWIQLFRVLMLAFVRNKGDESATCRYRYDCNMRGIVQLHGKVAVHMTTDTGEDETLVADLVIGADGASSKVRELMLPHIKRTYAGYVLLRGLVPFEQLTEETRMVTHSSGTMCFTRNSQAVSYTVPASKTGPPDSDSLLNWGWYQEKTEGELEELMTDVAGKKNFLTLPQGAMREEVANQVRAKAQMELPPQLAEAVAKTKAPFVQVITDAFAPQKAFWEGKVLLVGDAAGGQRPHTASAVSQACLHAHLLRLHVQGVVPLEQWIEETGAVSSALVEAGQAIGQVCLSETIDPGEKVRLYVAKYLPCQRLLAEKWAAFSVAGLGTRV